MASRSKSAGSSSRRRERKIRTNTLSIYFPGVLASVGDVKLNGRRLENILSLKVEIPANKNEPFVRVVAEFMSSVRIEGNPVSIVADHNRVHFTA